LLRAIDISKHRHGVLIGIPSKKHRRQSTITNTLEDFQRLAISLASYGLHMRIALPVSDSEQRCRWDVPAGWRISSGIPVRAADIRVSESSEWNVTRLGLFPL